MLLEIKVWGSRQWYEEVMPRLEKAGFTALEELGWADPETDGEYMGFYYEYTGSKPLRFAALSALLAEVATIIEGGEAPSVELNIIKDR